MIRKWINRGLAVILLLLVMTFIGIKAIPAEQLDQLWTKQQVEFIERGLVGTLIGFGALLAVFVFELPSGRRRTSNERDASVQAAQPKPAPKVELAIATTNTHTAVPDNGGTAAAEQISNDVDAATDEQISDDGGAAAAIKIITGYAQHIGEREEQQDSFGLADLSNTVEMKSDDMFVVLADGMGGYEMGKEAGELAVQTMLSEYASIAEEGKSTPRALEQSLHLANKAVYELALDHELEWSVGTTLIAVIMQEGQLHWISAGDSRIYLYRDGVLIPLTRDHVYANRLNELVQAGKLTQEEADSHPERHLLTSYLGIPRITEIDANLLPLQLTAGDWVLLCSDGFYDEITVPLLEEAVRQSPQDAAAFILEHVLAQQRPYQDNATIVIAACI
jgi:serine/threonine protein phosphatase PrpC